MKKIKGVVMRTSSKVTAIFTEKGDFLEIPTPKKPPVIGQTIEVNPNPGRLFMLQTSAMKYATAAVLLLVLSFSVFSFLFTPNMAVASVALDINKGVELLINKDGKVIKTQDVNGGSNMVEELSIKGLDVYQAVDLILESANYNGTLNKTQNLILVSVIPVNTWGTHTIDIEKLRISIFDEMTRRNITGSVVVNLVTKEIQEEAKQQGMTVNSYLIYDRCVEEGIAIQQDTLRDNAQKALVDAKVSASSLFPEECFEVTSSVATKHDPTVQNGQEYKHPSNMESSPTGEHSYTNSLSPGGISHENETAHHSSPSVMSPAPTGGTVHETETTPHSSPSVTSPAPSGGTVHENATTPHMTPSVTSPAPSGEIGHETANTPHPM